MEYDFVRSLGPAFLPHMLRRVSDMMVDGGMAWAKLHPTLPPPRTHSTMFALEERGELSVTELAALIRQSHPHALQWVRALEKLGLIARHHDPKDARKTILRLTERGAETLPEIRYFRSLNEEVTRCLCAELGDDLWERLRCFEALLNEQTYIARMTTAAQHVERAKR